MTQEDKAKAYDEALKIARCWLNDPQTIQDCNYTIEDAIQNIFPQLRESEDERIREELIEFIKSLLCNDAFDRYKLGSWITWLVKQKEQKPIDYPYLPGWRKNRDNNKPELKRSVLMLTTHGVAEGEWLGEKWCQYRWSCELKDGEVLYWIHLSDLEWLGKEGEEKQKEQKPIKIEVYEVGKGTTICGQDYKCKKDYKKGNCWYIKDVIYHCSRDGYLTDQNGVSWSCTPEWFKEYIQTNAEWAEEEKTRFVSGQFLQCKLSFDDFKEGEHYWLEYIGDDMYVGRSDNILNQKFHITPRQLFTLFGQQLDEVQGPPQEEKQVSLNYEPPFNENPSDIEIIDALIHSLNEQDGFLTAINCVSTKAILSWLEKQKEQKPTATINGEPVSAENHSVDIPLAEWSEEDEKRVKEAIKRIDELEFLGIHCNNVRKVLESLRPSWKPSDEQMMALQNAVALTACDKELVRLYEQLKKL